MELKKETIERGILAGFSQAYYMLAPVANPHATHHHQTKAHHSSFPTTISTLTSIEIAKSIFEVVSFRQLWKKVRQTRPRVANLPQNLRALFLID